MRRLDDILRENVVLLEEDKVREARKTINDAELETLTAEEIRQRISSMTPKERQEEDIDFFIGQLRDINLLTADDADTARDKFINDKTLVGLLGARSVSG